MQSRHQTTLRIRPVCEGRRRSGRPAQMSLLCKVRKKVERETGFEPATSTLARSHSTTELFPPERSKYHTVGVAFKRSRAIRGRLKPRAGGKPASLRGCSDAYASPRPARGSRSEQLAVRSPRPLTLLS